MHDKIDNKQEYERWIKFTTTEDCKVELCFECEFADKCTEFSEIRYS